LAIEIVTDAMLRAESYKSRDSKIDEMADIDVIISQAIKRVDSYSDDELNAVMAIHKYGAERLSED